MRPAARVAQALIRGYQLLLGPFMGGACRFEPSCSTYAMEAVATHGAVKGAWLTLRRLGRCHPFAAPGFDPVPPAGAGEALAAGHDAHR
jgi:putative membrane protein insertion efficiency factor